MSTPQTPDPMGARPTPAQRLSRTVAGAPVPPGPTHVEFQRLDLDGLPHYTADQAVNHPSGLQYAVTLGRIDRAIQDNPGGAARLLDALRALDEEGTDAAVDAVVEAHDTIEVPVTVGDVTVIHRGRIPRQRGSYLAAVLGVFAVVAAMLGLAPGSTPAASAATGPIAAMGPGLNLKAGPHHTVSRALHAGWWLVKDATGRVHNLGCISYNLRGPDGTAAAFSKPLPTPSPEADARLKTATNMTTGTDTLSGAVWWLAAAHILVDDPAARSKDAAALRADLPFYERQVPASVLARAAALREASKTHAPYTVTRSLKGAVPGQVGSETVTVRGSNGQPAAGLPVVFTVTDGTITSGGRSVTGRAGHATVTYRSTGIGQNVTYTLTTPSSTVVYANRPSAGRQVVIGGGFHDVTRGSDVAELCPVEASHRTVCPCKKIGDREITVTWTTAGLPGFYRGTVTVNGVEAGRADLNAGETGETTIHVQPGDTVEVGYAIYGTSTRTGAVLYSDVLDAWTQR